jgi:ribonuclease-3 family protein
MKNAEFYKTYSSLTLAYVGDAIYEAFIRTKLVENEDYKVNTLNKMAITFVSAKAQSVIVETLIEKMTEEELAVYKRGRNTKINSKSKNSDLKEYHNATGFEALIGYLYLTKCQERLDFFLNAAYNTIVC